MQDTTFLQDAEARGLRLRLLHQQHGQHFHPQQLYRYSLDVATNALHYERESHPHDAHHRAELRAHAFRTGYTSLLPVAIALPPSPHASHRRRRTPRKRHQPQA